MYVECAPRRSAVPQQNSLTSLHLDGELIGKASRVDWYRVIVWRLEVVSSLLEVAKSRRALCVERMFLELGVSITDLLRHHFGMPLMPARLQFHDLER
jgi:hypothetical protein